MLNAFEMMYKACDCLFLLSSQLVDASVQSFVNKKYAHSKQNLFYRLNSENTTLILSRTTAQVWYLANIDNIWMHDQVEFSL